jgi:hypothetical protein
MSGVMCCCPVLSSLLQADVLLSCGVLQAEPEGSQLDVAHGMNSEPLLDFPFYIHQWSHEVVVVV